jgi:3-deoxy-D-manno-octulosonic acid kinase
MVPIDGGELIFDAARIKRLSPQCLNVSWWQRQGTVRAAAAGRGAAALIDARGRQLVLRHYRRGGLVQHLVSDRYCWLGRGRTRSLAEWRLLFLLRRQGLPVPVPLAAGYRRDGPWYTADILLERIRDAETLALRLATAALPITQWVLIGHAIHRLHACGVDHADLNAHNILLDTAGKVWLIDFDRARLRKRGLWCDANLARLHRSLEKIALALPAGRYTRLHWAALLRGYLAPLTKTGF